MSTETVRRCDQCGAIMPPAITYYRMAVSITPCVPDAVEHDVMACSSGEFCGAQCVQRRIADTLVPGAVAVGAA